MKDKLYFPESDETKYKKKSGNKGLPRSKHKHVYETVLLRSDYHHSDLKTGRPLVNTTEYPTKVCTICGRVDSVDRSDKYYVKTPIVGLPSNIYKNELSEEALKLPRYHNDFWDKFAVKEDENNNETII